jgi:hypothetical protein
MMKPGYNIVTSSEKLKIDHFPCFFKPYYFPLAFYLSVKIVKHIPAIIELYHFELSEEILINCSFQRFMASDWLTAAKCKIVIPTQ